MAAQNADKKVLGGIVVGSLVLLAIAGYIALRAYDKSQTPDVDPKIIAAGETAQKTYASQQAAKLGKIEAAMAAVVKAGNSDEYIPGMKHDQEGYPVPSDKPIDLSGDPVAAGAALYKSKACVGCHTLDGNIGAGPTFKGLFGRTEKLQGGATVVVDDAYLIESMLQPNAKIVDGFQPVMPAGLVDEAGAKALVEYIKTIQ